MKWIAIILLAACSSTVEVPVDDAAVMGDATISADAGTSEEDSGTIQTDSGAPDSAMPLEDSGTDSGPVPTDSGSPDAGRDSGPADSGPVDAGCTLTGPTACGSGEWCFTISGLAYPSCYDSRANCDYWRVRETRPHGDSCFASCDGIGGEPEVRWTGSIYVITCMRTCEASTCP